MWELVALFLLMVPAVALLVHQLGAALLAEGEGLVVGVLSFSMRELAHLQAARLVLLMVVLGDQGVVLVVLGALVRCKRYRWSNARFTQLYGAGQPQLPD